MVEIDNKDIEYIKLLIGQPLSGIKRASDMGDFGFGEKRAYKIYNGKERIAPFLALHIQCPFRLISRNERIVFSAYDMYLSHNGERMEGMTWDVCGVNLYDIKTNEWIRSSPPLFVKAAKINNQGDLRIVFNTNDRLEIFVNCSTEVECWRFFELSSYSDRAESILPKHLVMTGLGVEYSL